MRFIRYKDIATDTNIGAIEKAGISVDELIMHRLTRAKVLFITEQVAYESVLDLCEHYGKDFQQIVENYYKEFDR